MFLNMFVLSAAPLVESGEKYDKAMFSALYKYLGEAWYDAERTLAAITAAEGAHELALT